MKTAIALLLVLSASAPSLATDPSIRPVREEKASLPTGVPDPQPQVGGDTIATATNIPFLPYWDTGNTCVYTNDYDEVCPYTGSLSGDVVYRFTAPADIAVSIELCNSYYDTKVYVYENVQGVVMACSDDACSGPNFPEPWLSRIECLRLSAGNTYYIVVDGYGGSCGDYILDVTECVGPCTGCPPDAVPEGEPECGPDYVDVFNGGCFSIPPVFSSIPCTEPSVTICGTYGGFLLGGMEYRDTDWYRIDVPAGGLADVTICAFGWYETIVGTIDGNAGCPPTGFVEYRALDWCEYGCFTTDLAEGTAWIFVAPLVWGPGDPCGATYFVTVDGLSCPVPVEKTSWARIKAGYSE